MRPYVPVAAVLAGLLIGTLMASADRSFDDARPALGTQVLFVPPSAAPSVITLK